MSTVLKLYDIVDALTDIEAILEERGGELDDEIEARLDAIESDLSTKVERVCQWRSNIVASAKAYQDEADRLSKRAKTLTRTADSLKRYLHAELERCGRQKLEAGTWRLRIHRNSQPSVRLKVSPAELPEAYRRVSIDADRAALLKAWNEGTPGDEIEQYIAVQVGNHLRIT